jgi:YVTN family beta-propeller protein
MLRAPLGNPAEQTWDSPDTDCISRSTDKGSVVHVRKLFTILALLVLTGCQTQLAALKPVLSEESELFLYLQPFPHESDRLSFTLDSVVAVREDGAEFPLELSLHDLTGPELRRQRFLASGRIPPGTYRGLALHASTARLKTDGAPASLLTGTEATVLDVPFTVRRQQARLLTLTFDYPKSVRQGFAFAPIFTIQVPGRPVTGLTGYVTIPAANTIAVFDKQYHQVVGVMATGKEPRGLVFDQQRKRAYVALSGEDAIAVIDIVTGEEVRRIRLLNGDGPTELALTPDGKTLLSVNPGSNTVSFIDPLSYFESTRAGVGDGPAALLIDPAGQRAYVFNGFASTISVLDIARRAVLATVASEPGASRGGFNRAGDKLYVIHDLGSYLTVYNPLTMAQQQRLYVGMGMTALKVDPLTDLIYAGKKQDAQTEVYEPFSFNRLATITIGGSAGYLTMDGEENRLYAENARQRSLQVINLVNYRVEAELDLGEEPGRVALMGER